MTFVPPYQTPFIPAYTPIPTPTPVPQPPTPVAARIAYIYCGDGIVQTAQGEQCDAGTQNALPASGCTRTCKLLAPATCGNKVVDPGEECDDGNRYPFDTCTNDCYRRSGTCGDGQVDKALGEQCDDGQANGQPGESCSTQCTIVPSASCGNGIVDPREECDAGSLNGKPPYTCLSNCVAPACGDGILEANEECDDGNLLGFDRCDAYCQREGNAAAAELIPVQPEQTYTGRVPTPAKTPTGPGLVIFLVSGAAAGYGIMRRRFAK